MLAIDSLNYAWKDGRKRYRHDFDDLANHVGCLSEEEARQISAYMGHFVKDEGWLSYPTDPLDESIVVDWNGGSDGTYRWNGLTHYFVEKYRVDPPLVFRRHVAERLKSGIDLPKEARLVNPLPIQQPIGARRRKASPPKPGIKEEIQYLLYS